MTNHELKFLKSLQQKKFRRQHGCFLVEGRKSVEETLDSNFIVKAVYATTEWKTKNEDFIHPFTPITAREATQISMMKTPPEVFALVEMKHQEICSAGHGHILILDGIRDAGNVGAMLRTADWFGIRTVVCSEDTAEIYNPKTIQASMGSFTRVDVMYCNPVQFIREYAKRFTFYGTFLDGKPLQDIVFAQPTAVVLGSESHGISPQVAELLPNRLHIPRMDGNLSSAAESLNVSLAAGIICRQMELTGKH
jgi:TrmH family RNA methyltransferase